MSKQKGFTLIEIMVAVVIVALLASVAIPSYRDQVRKSRRADGEALLLNIAQQEERFFTTNGTYTADMTALGYTGAGVWAKSPDKHYRARLQNTANCALPDCYRLLSRALNVKQQEDGNLRLWSTGRKQRAASGGGWQEGWN